MSAVASGQARDVTVGRQRISGGHLYYVNAPFMKEAQSYSYGEAMDIARERACGGKITRLWFGA